MRVTELVTLELEDVSLPGRWIVCRGKRNKQRKVLMGQSAAYWLRTYVGVKAALSKPRVGRRRLFEENDRPMTRHRVWEMITSYAHAAELPRVTPHMLRHSFATHMMLNGASTRHVQELLGHADISTTQVYTHLTVAQLQARYNQFHPRNRPQRPTEGEQKPEKEMKSSFPPPKSS